jgi:hypothetical protein
MPSNANLSGLTERRSTSINLLSTSRSNIPASVVTGSAAMPGTRRSSLSTRRRGRFDVKVSRNRTPSAYAARLGLDPGAFCGHSLSLHPRPPTGFAIQDDGREPAAVGRRAARPMCATPVPSGSNDCAGCVGARRPRATKPQPASTTAGSAAREGEQIRAWFHERRRPPRGATQSERQQRWPSVRPLRVVSCKTCS